MKKIINKILITSISILIIIASVIVGTPLKGNTKIISIITLAIFIIYVIIYKIIIKKKLKNIKENINPLDIAVLILCMSTFIPIIAQTAINVQDSIYSGIKYITVLMIYIITRIAIKEEEKNKKYIQISLILAGVISAIIGIDNLTFKVFQKKLYHIGIPLVVNPDNRMIGNFGYANTFALNILVALILNIDNCTKKSKYKIVCLAINFIFICCIILSYSKAIYILLIAISYMYIKMQKEPKTKVTIFISEISTLFIAIIFMKIFTSFFQVKNYIGIIIMLVQLTTISVAINILIIKFIENKEIEIRKYKKILALTLMIITCIICIGLFLKEPLLVFTNESQTEKVKYILQGITPNKEYKFKFNLEAKSLYNKKIYIIKISEKDENYKDLNEHEIKINTYLGEKTIEFESNPKAKYFELTFETKNPKEQKGLKINSLKINDKEYILNYKYLPASLVNKIKTLNMKNVSVTERLTFYKDALKLIKQNPITGIGGNGWYYKYEEVRSYDYEAKQVHSYPLQIFLENGIIGFCAYIAILILVVIYENKQKNKEIRTSLALNSILIHSIIDFDLSFMNILIYTFLLLGIISSGRENHKEGRKNHENSHST